MANFFDQFDEQSLPNGMIEQGNIDIHNRPVVKNQDGSISTVRSMSANFDGREVLIPTVSDDGRIMSDDEAIDNYLRTGKHLGMFSTPEDATAYAESLHNQQAEEYLPQESNFFDRFDAPPQPENSYIAGMKQANQNLSQGLQQSSEDAKGFRESVIDAFTGESKMTPEVQGLEGIMSSPEMNAFNTDAMKAAWVQMFGNDNDFVKVIGNMGGKVSQDEKGNLLVDLPSGRYALNKPGLSSEDVMPFIANAVAFTPAARAPTIVGATARSAGTDLALQSSVNMAGGGDINPWQTALSAGIGGVGKVAERGVNALARGSRGNMSQQAQADVAFAAENNLPLMTTDAVKPRTFQGRAAQALAEKIPFVGTGAQRRSQQEAREGLVEHVVREIGNSNPADMVASLNRKSGGNGYIRTASGNRLNQISQEMTSIGNIQTNRTLSAIDAEIANLNRMGGVADNATINQLTNYRNEIANGADFQRLRDIRTQFREDVRGDRINWPNRSQSAVNRVYRAMGDDLNDSVVNNLGDRAGHRYRQANNIYAREAEEANNTRLKTVLNKGDLTPEVVNNLLFSKNRSEVARLYRSLDNQGRQSARAAIIGKAYDASGGSPDKFLNAINKLGDQTGIFFRGEDRRYITGMTRYLDATRRASKAGVVTPTGQELLQFGVPAGVAVDILGNGGALTAAFGSYGALARVYESRPIRNLMLRLANTPRGSTAYDRTITNIMNAVTAIAQEEAR